MQRRSLFGFGAAAAAGAVAGAGLAPEVALATGRADRTPVPNTEVVDQDGQRYRFYDDLVRDRVVLLNFFFTSCGETCPLVTENLLGGEEGISDAGVSVAHLIPNAVLFLELTGEVYAARSEVFESDDKSHLAYVGRVRAYRDLSESTNLDLGFSYAHGPTTVGQVDVPEGETAPVLARDIYGADISFRYRPLREAIYRRFNLRTELIWSRQQLPLDARTTAFGFYALAEYQFARRWYVGARADRSGRALDGAAVDHGWSAFMTFWPTEFSQVRGQYRYTRFDERVSGHEFLFQFNFSIGAHGAHVF